MEHGAFWACDRCRGRALSVELLRRTFARDPVNFFWSRVIAHLGAPGRDCLCCGRLMTEVALADTPETSRIDVCQLCHFVWFDADEISQLTPRDPAAELTLAAREATAIPEIHRLARAAEGRDLDGALLDAWWKKVVRALGYWFRVIGRRGAKNGCHPVASAYFPSPTFPKKSVGRTAHLIPFWDRISE